MHNVSCVTWGSNPGYARNGKLALCLMHSTYSILKRYILYIKSYCHNISKWDKQRQHFYAALCNNTINGSLEICALAYIFAKHKIRCLGYISLHILYDKSIFGKSEVVTFQIQHFYTRSQEAGFVVQVANQWPKLFLKPDQNQT